MSKTKLQGATLRRKLRVRTHLGRRRRPHLRGFQLPPPHAAMTHRHAASDSLAPHLRSQRFLPAPCTPKMAGYESSASTMPQSAPPGADFERWLTAATRARAPEGRDAAQPMRKPIGSSQPCRSLVRAGHSLPAGRSFLAVVSPPSHTFPSPRFHRH